MTNEVLILLAALYVCQITTCLVILAGVREQEFFRTKRGFFVVTLVPYAFYLLIVYRMFRALGRGFRNLV